MRLLFVLVFVALASATSEPSSVELPAPSLPTVTQQTKEETSAPAVVAESTSAKVDTSLTTGAASTLEAIKIQTPLTTVESPPEVIKESSKPTDEIPVKVAQNFQYSVQPDLSKLHVEDLPINDPEAMRKLFPNPMSLIDIRPLLVPQEVMRQVAQMAKMAPQETDAVNVGGAHPFSFDNAEPLDSVERVNVVDTPMNQLDAKMNPVLVVESPTGEQASFAEIPQVPESVKVVNIGDQNIPVDMRPLPVQAWRGPPQNQIPQENWRVPNQIPLTQDISSIPLHFLREYNPLPSYYRDVPGYPRHRWPKFSDPMLR